VNLKTDRQLNLPNFDLPQSPNNSPTDAEIDTLLQRLCGAMQVLISYAQLSMLCVPRDALSSLDTRKTEALMSFALLETVNRITSLSDLAKMLIYISPVCMRTSLSKREQWEVTKILDDLEQIIDLDGSNIP